MTGTEEYQREVRRLRSERRQLTGVPSEPVEDAPKRMTLSRVLELLLARHHSSDRSSITLSRNTSGETAIEVKVRTGDNEGDVQTIAEAERVALDTYARLIERYPPPAPHDNAAVSLSRNAKGETQVEVKASTSAEGVATLDALAEKLVDAYDKARMRYPMADGHTAKPGSVK